MRRRSRCSDPSECDGSTKGAVDAIQSTVRRPAETLDWQVSRVWSLTEGGVETDKQPLRCTLRQAAIATEWQVSLILSVCQSNSTCLCHHDPEGSIDSELAIWSQTLLDCFWRSQSSPSRSSRPANSKAGALAQTEAQAGGVPTEEEEIQTSGPFFL